MFRTWRSSRSSPLDVLAALGFCLLAASAAAPPALAQKLTLDRLATAPYLSGTPPMTPSWSPDGKRLAFLWNDQALPFRDIWLVDASGTNLRRLTDMAKVVPDVEDPGLTDDAARAWQITARARTGIARIPPCCLAFPATRYAPVWAPDGQSLVFPYRGAIWSVNADGSGAPTRLTESAGDKYAIAFSADGTYLSYLQDGDLWLLNRKTRERVQATRRAVPPLGIIQDGDFTRPQAEFSTYAWSPNGDYIALHFDDRRAVRTLLFPNYLGEETTAVPVRRDYTGDNAATRTLVVLAVKKGRPRRHRSPQPAGDERLCLVRRRPAAHRPDVHGRARSVAVPVRRRRQVAQGDLARRAAVAQFAGARLRLAVGRQGRGVRLGQGRSSSHLRAGARWQRAAPAHPGRMECRRRIRLGLVSRLAGHETDLLRLQPEESVRTSGTIGWPKPGGPSRR